ncbi:MAG TPA: D-glycerate dehydrogenase [Firmicutes bacterium]|nr:D-glycerate dehydrogenase [Bacillota bacterium]
MKVFVTQRIHPKGIEILESVAQVTLNDSGFPLSRQQFLKEISEADALIVVSNYEIVDREALDAAPRLKVIARHGVVYDNVDIAEATNRGICVTCCPVHSPTVADMTFALICTAARRIHLADQAVRNGRWATNPGAIRDQLTGVDVTGSTLGIIGFGRIGVELAKRARAFDMRIICNDPVHNDVFGRDLGVEWVTLPELLRESDFVSVNCSLTRETYHLIGTKELGMMKRSAIIINTSRGQIIDEDALCRALQEGVIGGAALDVYSDEPPSIYSPLLELDNVVLAPHLGSATVELREKMARVVAEDVVRALGGWRPIYLVNLDVMKIRALPEAVD